MALSVVLAFTETWLGIALARVTDWPPSFWITLLSAGIYGLTFCRPSISWNRDDTAERTGRTLSVATRDQSDWHAGCLIITAPRLKEADRPMRTCDRVRKQIGEGVGGQCLDPPSSLS
jgi:hypothetical protein